ncbi:hypothetical protein PPYR_09187 [Photinus pyralis]|uniref:Uncharacterized protein n=1 Tax=Photinus pyralis TaxID=7054 RepID=A0A5N4ALK6_PHOPY|nr:hypothetical protein PPYR_09187 [Photinus pyralis]
MCGPLQLSTPCEKLLSACFWHGVKFDCKELFNVVPTSKGFCCGLDQTRLPSTKTVNHMLSKRTGLSVEVMNDIDDYYFMLSPAVGINIYVLEPTHEQYPNPRSTSVIDMFAPAGQETNIILIPNILYTENIRGIDLSSRKCLFHDEKGTIFGPYSYNNCIGECRLRSRLALCKCKTFSPKAKINAKTCTFSDIPCLFKHQEKWNNLSPNEKVNTMQLNQEIDNGLNCNDCYPDCTRYYYEANIDSVPLISNDTNLVINVYFGTNTPRILTANLMMLWYEVIASIGGILGIYFGVSYIKLLQIIRLVFLKCSKTYLSSKRLMK